MMLLYGNKIVFIAQQSIEKIFSIMFLKFSRAFDPVKFIIILLSNIEHCGIREVVT